MRTTGTGGPDDAFDAIEQIDKAQNYLPFDEWLTKVIRFRREPLDDLHVSFKLHWNQGTLLPIEPWQELIGEEQLTHPMTYDRVNAAYHQGIRLIRPGFELVDSVTKLLRWDDRGTAFATWRVDPRWSGEGRGVWMGFRLTFVLEANVELARKVMGNWADESTVQSLRRRMDYVLPPWTTTIDVDIEMNEAKEVPLLNEILALPYSTRENELGQRDFNLGSRREALYELIGFNELSDLCAHVRETSEKLLRNSAQFQEWANTKVQGAIRDLRIDRDHLQWRKDAVVRENGKLDIGLERDISVNEAITSALGSPSIRLDAIGLFVISNRPPSLEEREDTQQSQEVE